MRQAREQDVEPIMAALLAMLPKSPAPQMRYAEPKVAEAGVRRALAEGRGYFFGGYFVMVDVGSDWYTNATFLIEQIILKVYPDNRSWAVSAIVGEGLSLLAEHFKADAIVVGDTQIDYMRPIYHTAGYKTLGTQLMKENLS